MSDASAFGEIGAIIDIVKAGSELIGKAIKTLNQKRSVVVEVDNNTDFTLGMVRDFHDHGGFSDDLPSGQIAPKSADVFGSQSNANSLFTGTEGRITYQGDDFTFYIHWDNPFLGENSCGSIVLGRKGHLFQTKAICGNQNEKAKMRFVLSPSTQAFKIVNRWSGKVLDVPDSLTGNNVIIQQYKYNGGENQQWQVIPVAGSYGAYYRIRNRHSQLVLDVPNESEIDNEKIQQYEQTTGLNQQWRLVPVAGGLFPLTGSYFKIINRKSRKLLDVPESSTADQVQIQQYHDNGGPNQQWILAPV
jgi:hypothetical protein